MEKRYQNGNPIKNGPVLIQFLGPNSIQNCDACRIDFPPCAPASFLTPSAAVHARLLRKDEFLSQNKFRFLKVSTDLSRPNGCLRTGSGKTKLTPARAPRFEKLEETCRHHFRSHVLFAGKLRPRDSHRPRRVREA